MTIKIILVEPAEEGNIGSVARVMKNFGFSELALVNPCAIGGIARAFSANGADVLENAVNYKTIKEAIADCGFIIGTTSKYGRSILRREILTPWQLTEITNSLNVKIAILFGRESNGLTNDELKLCDSIVTIPCSAYNSLNLAQSVGIILYELVRTKKQKKKRYASSQTITELFLQINKVIESVTENREKAKNIKRKIKKIIARAGLTENEAGCVIGLCKKLIN